MPEKPCNGKVKQPYLKRKEKQSSIRLAYHLDAARARLPPLFPSHRPVRVALEISRGRSGGVRVETPAGPNIASCKRGTRVCLWSSPRRFIPGTIIGTSGELDRKTSDRNARQSSNSALGPTGARGQFLERIGASLVYNFLICPREEFSVVPLIFARYC